MSDYSQLSMANSYVYWQHWFAMPKINPGVSKLEKQGYIWPGGLEMWDKMLNGRECPICHGQRFFNIPNLDFHGLKINNVFCLCAVLETKADPFPRESEWNVKWMDKFEIDFGNAKKTNNYIVRAVNEFIEYPMGWHYLYGGVGSGKTMLLQAIKTQLQGLALYLTTEELHQWIHKAIGEHNLDEVIDYVATSSILLLDDFGAEYSNEFYLSALYSIINRRYNSHQKFPTFFTSNMTFKEMSNSSSTQMRRLVDRISDVGITTVYVSTQPSYRQRG